MTMAYILAVCPNIMGQTGMPSGGVFVATVGAAFAGTLFTALSLTPVREGVFNAIPLSLKKALAAGIGFFICFIALQSAGLVVDHPATLVQMVPFRDVPFHSRGISAFLAFAGTLLTGALLVHRVKAAILIGILATWGSACSVRRRGSTSPIHR